ncbi:hypothetical protein C7N43_06860 [Sphingobacteriales bacterium UPWRP_1]|nr:hypothetical protein BVG80_13305 [Sphingobacteriales bacterium TSM_CSM]PSJ77803.1 hypothetical protein C7N43_06860 [Sphingobacteriales bacterium UPWRP_1]
MFDLRLETLHLENFRGFGNLEVTFDPDITIFISENGGGKSTILDATAECLRFFYQYALVRQKYETKFKSTDVKNGLHAASCRLVVNMEYPYTELNKSKTNNTDEDEEEDDRPIHNGICFWELNLNENGGTEVKYAQGNIANSITIEGYRIATNVLRKKENLPILVYYGRNAFNRPQAAGNAKVKSRIDAVYTNALEPERFSFNQLYQWYDEKQRLALQEKDTKIKKFQDDITALEQELTNIAAQKAKLEGEVKALKLDEEIVAAKIAQLRKNKQTYTTEYKELKEELKTLKQKIQIAEAVYVKSLASFENVKTEQETYKNKLDLLVQGKSLDEELDLLNNAVLDMLNDDDKRYSNFRLDYKSKEFAFDKLTHDNKTETISFSQMSSGEKALFALVADLVRRIIAANPTYQPTESVSGQTAVQQTNPLNEGKGIVLIDEIDQHLHPLWQQKVLSKLRKIFPKLQFVVTTHSPLVFINIQVGKVLKLKNLALIQHKFFKGLHLVDVFYEYYGIKMRPDFIQHKIDTLFELLEDEPENFTAANKMLEEIIELVGENDRAVIEAKTFMSLPV